VSIDAAMQKAGEIRFVPVLLKAYAIRKSNRSCLQPNNKAL
jgi:hypothetical protein